MLLSSSRRAIAGELIWSGCWRALTGTACHGRMRCALLKPRAATALIMLSTSCMIEPGQDGGSC